MAERSLGPGHASAVRRPALASSKLAGLFAAHLDADPRADSVRGSDPGTPVELPIGAALVAAGTGWVLLEPATERRVATPGAGLGAALAWAVRAGVDRLRVLATGDAPIHARRAAGLTMPVDVWRVDGADLRPVESAPLPEPAPAPPSHLALADLIADSGATVTIEHAVVTGEVRGLEVCRVVDREAPSGAVGAVLEVGIGARDREAFAMLHGDVPTVAALAEVVRRVEAQRREGAPPHPLNGLAAERFVRWRLERSPGLVGAATVVPCQPPVPRANVADAVPCCAVADDGTARRRDLVCSAGVDLDLVPFALDAQRRGVDMALVLPAGDLLPLTRDLAALMRVPPELVAVP